MQMFYGGDSLNTALYLARLGGQVDYVTKLGDDTSSYWLKSEWESEGIGCQWVSHEENASPGMYMIETDEEGERFFSYWRDNSPATRLFSDVSTLPILYEGLSSFDHILLTGITLSLYPQEGLDELLAFAERYANTGGKIIFDGNYRPKSWCSEARAQEIYEALYMSCAIALPTFEDEQALFGDETPEATIERLHSYGVSIVVLKLGGEGCVVSEAGCTAFVPTQKVKPVDTTAAGDSFNAGFLRGYLSGLSLEKSALIGHKVAGTVIQHRGAIIAAELIDGIKRDLSL